MISLRDALKETLQGWSEDIDPAWRDLAGAVQLDFSGVPSGLTLGPWEPIFPTRRNLSIPGEPEGAHILRAFDDIPPSGVRCVLLGQDPYPCPAFSTGRAFEAGNTACWRELDKMFSKSVRALLLQIADAKIGRSEFAAGFERWPDLLVAIESGAVSFDEPGRLADRWVGSGALLLNSSLTLSRFQVDVDPHQSEGHLRLWRPLIIAVLRHLAARQHPLVVITFGYAAADNAKRAAILQHDNVLVINRPHPAHSDEFLACENPFLACNVRLREAGVPPIDW